MGITPEEYEWLTAVLADLEPELKRVYPSGRKFLEDQMDRLEKYGERMFLSPKQKNWIKNLHEEFGSGAIAEREEENPQSDYDQPHGDASDDEIPF